MGPLHRQLRATARHASRRHGTLEPLPSLPAKRLKHRLDVRHASSGRLHQNRNLHPQEVVRIADVPAADRHDLTVAATDSHWDQVGRADALVGRIERDPTRARQIDFRPGVGGPAIVAARVGIEQVARDSKQAQWMFDLANSARALITIAQRATATELSRSSISLR